MANSDNELQVARDIGEINATMKGLADSVERAFKQQVICQERCDERIDGLDERVEELELVNRDRQTVKTRDAWWWTKVSAAVMLMLPGIKAYAGAIADWIRK